jgi:hypothetical protein
MPYSSSKINAASEEAIPLILKDTTDVRHSKSSVP